MIGEDGSSLPTEDELVYYSSFPYCFQNTGTSTIQTNLTLNSSEEITSNNKDDQN